MRIFSSRHLPLLGNYLFLVYPLLAEFVKTGQKQSLLRKLMHKIYNFKQYFAHVSFWTFPLYNISSEKDPFIALGLTGWKLEIVKHVKEDGHRQEQWLKEIAVVWGKIKEDVETIKIQTPTSSKTTMYISFLYQSLMINRTYN